MPTAAPARPARRDDAAPPLLRIAGVGVRFGAQDVLRDISLDLDAGRTLVILGESGCGKTVLLKTMIGLIRPTAGDVLFEGRALARMGERELTGLRTRYGFVFQGAALFDSLSIADNIAFPLREHTRVSEAEIADIVVALVDEVGLPRSALAKKPVELSGGMRKRAGLARALALDPQVVLYDEPTTGLDPIRSDVINELILKLKRELRVTSIVVTHDLASAFKVADHMVMMHEGSVVLRGSPEEFRQSDNPVVRRFLRGEASEEELRAIREVGAENRAASRRTGGAR
ncbi:MAG: ABC transporter ATP-binding protein [Planctomycetaceae bacterium]